LSVGKYSHRRKAQRTMLLFKVEIEKFNSGRSAKASHREDQ
jgi:hypothetical protein